MKDLIRVALIDDHTLMLDCLFCMINQEPDLEVITATGDGKGFLHLMTAAPQEQKIDVIVLDLEMPYHGFELLTQLGHIPHAPHVLILTGFAGAENIRRAMLLGAHGLVLKTDPFPRILDAIRQVAQGCIIFPRGAQRWLMPTHDDIEELSSREIEVLKYVARGLTNSEIAHYMQISKNTVSYHLKNIFHKLNVTNRTEATVWYFSNQSSFS